ncbi:hypothetical protein ES703_19757 [subsurface metagenome]
MIIPSRIKNSRRDIRDVRHGKAAINRDGQVTIVLSKIDKYEWFNNQHHV